MVDIYAHTYFTNNSLAFTLFQVEQLLLEGNTFELRGLETIEGFETFQERSMNAGIVPVSEAEPPVGEGEEN